MEPFVRNTLGIAYDLTGNIAAAQAAFTQTLVLAREVGDAQTLARVLTNLTPVEADDGDAAAHAMYEESIAISRAAGDDAGAHLVGQVAIPADQCQPKGRTALRA